MMKSPYCNTLSVGLNFDKAGLLRRQSAALRGRCSCTGATGKKSQTARRLEFRHRHRM